jgi:phage recombination protein Bet
MTTETTAEAGRDVTVRQYGELDVGRPAYLEYSKERVELIRRTLLPKEANDNDLFFLLELSSRYGLDPFAREIWIAKMKGKSGEQGGIAVFVGRDGLLSLAERRPGYRGFRNEAVHKGDTFKKLAQAVEQPDGTWTYVQHEYGHPAERGELVGAYAEVYVDGRPPTYFFAYLDEYLPGGNKLEYSPWRQQKAVMIEKCALVTAMRHAIRMSGLYLEEEMAAAIERGAATEMPTEGEAPNYGDDPVLAQRLQDLFEALDYLPAKRRVLLATCDDDGRRHLAEKLEADAEEAGIELPPWPEAIADGEVVEEEDEPAAAEPEPPSEPAAESEPEPTSEAEQQTLDA